MTGNYEFSLSNRENLPLQIQVKLSKKLSTFYVFALKFLESIWNFQCSEKEMDLIDQVFLKLLSQKDAVI